MAKKIVRLTESQMINLVTKILNEQNANIPQSQPSPMKRKRPRQITPPQNAYNATAKILLGDKRFNIERVSPAPTGCSFYGRYLGIDQMVAVRKRCNEDFVIDERVEKVKISVEAIQLLNKICRCGKEGGYVQNTPEAGSDQSSFV